MSTGPPSSADGDDSPISQPTIPAISSDGDDEGDDVRRVLPPREHDDVVVVVVDPRRSRPLLSAASTPRVCQRMCRGPRRVALRCRRDALGEGGNADVALLDVQDVTVRFGGIVALDGLSFTIDEGQICGLIGPNGAGKTTMFNVVSRIYEPTAGRVVFDGDGPAAVRAARHRRARHRPHVPEPRPVPDDDAARERDGRRPQPGQGRLRAVDQSHRRGQRRTAGCATTPATCSTSSASAT